MTKEQIKAYEEQLKPCPFCGGKAQIFNQFGWFWGMIWYLKGGEDEQHKGHK